MRWLNWESCILSQQFQYYHQYKQKQQVQLFLPSSFSPLQFLLVNLSKMQVNKIVNFHYSHQGPIAFGQRQTLASQHVVNSAKILRFNYQNYQVPQQRREVKMYAYPSGRVESSTLPASNRLEESETSSRKIKLLIAKKRRLSEKMKEIPYFISSQLKVNESHHESKLQSQHRRSEQKEEKVGVNDAESVYIPLQKDHISVEYPKNCGIFSFCEETMHNEAQYQQKNFEIIREQESECQRIQMPEEEERFFPIKSTQYHKEAKAGQSQHPYRYTNRRRMFSESLPPRKMFTIKEEYIDSTDIPAAVSANWSILQQHSQWKPQSPTQNASPEFQNSPNTFSDIQVSS